VNFFISSAGVLFYSPGLSDHHKSGLTVVCLVALSLTVMAAAYISFTTVKSKQLASGAVARIQKSAGVSIPAVDSPVGAPTTPVSPYLRRRKSIVTCAHGVPVELSLMIEPDILIKYSRALLDRPDPDQTAGFHELDSRVQASNAMAQLQSHTKKIDTKVYESITQRAPFFVDCVARSTPEERARQAMSFAHLMQFQHKSAYSRLFKPGSKAAVAHYLLEADEDSVELFRRVMDGVVTRAGKETESPPTTPVSAAPAHPWANKRADSSTSECVAEAKDSAKEAAQPQPTNISADIDFDAPATRPVTTFATIPSVPFQFSPAHTPHPHSSVVPTSAIPAATWPSEPLYASPRRYQLQEESAPAAEQELVPMFRAAPGTPTSPVETHFSFTPVIVDTPMWGTAVADHAAHDAWAPAPDSEGLSPSLDHGTVIV